MIGYDAYCTHIESKLPPKVGRLKAFYVDASRITQRKEPSYEVAITRLEKSLERCGLPYRKIQLVIARAIEKRPFVEIVKQYRSLSTEGNAHYHYKSALKQLRKLGYK